MTQELIIVGCGGFGREVFSLVDAAQHLRGEYIVKGFVDDDPSDADRLRVRQLGSEMLGSLNRLSEFTDTAAVIAVGSPRVRKAIENRTSHLRFRWATLVHPTATVGLNVRLGEGTIVAAGARLSTNINVGAHVQLDTNVTIGHDCDIASFARVNPGACVSGSVEIGQGALIGANATVLQCLRVGSAAVVGAAACVVADVVPGTTVKGVPAR